MSLLYKLINGIMSRIRIQDGPALVLRVLRFCARRRVLAAATAAAAAAFLACTL